jgi:hypothetical protein
MYAIIPFYESFSSSKEHFFEPIITVYPNASAYCSDMVQYIKDVLSISNGSYSHISIIHISEFPSNVDRSSFIILLSGEPDPIHQSVNITIAPFCGQPQPSIYYPFLYQSLGERHLQTYSKQTKTKMCAFMYRQDYSHRNEWFHRINKYIHVDALGSACKNTSVPTTRHIHNENETYNDIAVKTYAEYYFVLAIENTWKDGYFTEKLINPLIAHSIPLYWGHPKVFDYINKKRVFYLPDYHSDEEIIKKMNEIQQDQDAYEKIISEPWYTNDGDPQLVNDLLKKQLQEIIYK